MKQLSRFLYFFLLSLALTCSYANTHESGNKILSIGDHLEPEGVFFDLQSSIGCNAAIQFSSSNQLLVLYFMDKNYKIIEPLYDRVKICYKDYDHPKKSAVTTILSRRGAYLAVTCLATNPQDFAILEFKDSQNLYTSAFNNKTK